MTKYLIFSDLDGTLADVDHDVNEHTKSVVRAVLDEGHDFYIATGRMMSLVADIAHSIDPRVKVVASNGGIIQDGNTFHKRLMDKELIPLIYKTAMEYDIPTLFFTDNDILYTHFVPEFFGKTNGYHERHGIKPLLKKVENIEEDMMNFDIINALSTIRDDNSEVISTDVEALGRLAKANSVLKDIAGLSIASSAPDNLEIYPSTTSKGNALNHIASQLDKSNTMVFGDGYNDVSMFKVAQQSVAMGNAPEGVKDVAKHETLSNGDNGVAHFLAHYFLK